MKEIVHQETGCGAGKRTVPPGASLSGVSSTQKELTWEIRDSPLSALATHSLLD